MTNISKGKHSSAKLKSMGDHDAFLCRITKSLYYSKLPMTDRLSLPVTELAAEIFTEVKGGLTLERLDVEEAGRISRNACVSPCSLVLALLYLERLKDCNPEYLHRVAPSELFLVSLMVASKFLNDDGEEDEVFNMEWAKSGDLTIEQINRLEKDFLGAIDWAIFVQNKDFWERLTQLEKDIAYKEGRKRGWFSYNELSCLMDNVPLVTLIHTFASVYSICLATYAAGLVTLLGSVLVASQLPGTSLVPPQDAQRSNAPVANLTDSGMIPRDLASDLETTIESAQLSEYLASDVSSLYDSCENCTDSRNSTHESRNWEWWLNPIMMWLPTSHSENYFLSGIYETIDNNRESEESMENGVFKKLVENEKLKRTGAFITSSQWFDDESYVRQTENIVMEINWKETLASNLEMANNDWRQYTSKISFGHRH